jgi:hypothetical protein
MSVVHSISITLNSRYRSSEAWVVKLNWNYYILIMVIVKQAMYNLMLEFLQVKNEILVLIFQSNRQTFFMFMPLISL